MLAGNLASIGVGGIVACFTSYFVSAISTMAVGVVLDLLLSQWPEDFDFEITRAINAPHSEDGSVSPKESPDLDEKKDPASADTVSVSSSRDSEEAELDPIMLGKAFRFAAWSSVILVRISSTRRGSASHNLDSSW